MEDKATSLKMTRHQKWKIDETHMEGDDHNLDFSTHTHPCAPLEKNSPIFLLLPLRKACILMRKSVLSNTRWVMKSTEVAFSQCLRLMARRTRFMGRIFVTWRTCFLIIRHFTMMLICSCSMFCANGMLGMSYGETFRGVL